MDFRQLASLVALSELGNLSSVGGQLHLSAAAIQKQLKSLSQEFGIQVYRKVGRRLELSDEARLLIPYARAMLATHSAAAAAMRHSKSDLRGMVHLGAGPAIATHLLPKLIRRFLLQHPNWGLTVETGSNTTLISHLLAGQLELVLSCGLQDDQDLLSFEFAWETELVLAVRAALYPRSVDLSDLRRLPLILFPPDGNIDDLILSSLAKAAFKPLTVLRVDNSETIRSLALQGVGIGVLPCWTVSRDLRLGMLKLVSVESRPFVSTLALVTLKGRYRSPAAQALIEMMRHHSWNHPRLLHTARPKA